MLPQPEILWLINTDLDPADRHGTKMSTRNHHGPLVESQHHVIDSTGLCRALDDGVQNRLHVRGRAADNAQHFGCRRLMLQRLAQFRVTLLQFLEQTHVLDGDHGLISERLEQRYLFIGECANLGAANSNNTDRYAFSQKWSD